MGKYFKGLYYVDDVNAEPTGISSPHFEQSIDFVAFGNIHGYHERYLYVIQFLTKLLDHFAQYNVHPEEVVRYLMSGRLMGNQVQVWLDHLQEVQAIPPFTEDFRKYLQQDHLQSMILPSINPDHDSYLDIPAPRYRQLILTIQQLLVEYGVVLNGGPVEVEELEEFRDNLCVYQPKQATVHTLVALLVSIC